MIQFTCSCGSKFTLKDELAGTCVQCKECGASVSVPRKAEEQNKPQQGIRRTV